MIKKNNKPLETAFPSFSLMHKLSRSTESLRAVCSLWPSTLCSDAMSRQYGWGLKSLYKSSETPPSSPLLGLVALLILVNTYLEQSSVKLYSGHSSSLHLNSVFLSVGYLINKTHCQLEHASGVESSTANLCSFLPPASWRHIKLRAWSLGSGNPELLGNSKEPNFRVWSHWAGSPRYNCTHFLWVCFFFNQPGKPDLHTLTSAESIFCCKKMCWKPCNWLDNFTRH